jgi:hypothetical protein
MSRSVWDLSQLALVFARVTFRYRAAKLMLDVCPAGTSCPSDLSCPVDGCLSSAADTWISMASANDAERATAAGYGGEDVNVEEQQRDDAEYLLLFF